MKIDKLSSKANLRLAWDRILTGANGQYKKYFREMYAAYQISIDKNLDDLKKRIIAGTYQTIEPITVYQPKPSGLQRPIKLLDIEDQIVLQAIANLFEIKLECKRTPLMDKYVFSNFSQGSKSIFFFRSWKDGYQNYCTKIENKFYSGHKCIAEYDLAAFYDTIDHKLLVKELLPRTTSGHMYDFLINFLNHISSNGHGLPQGPIASDYLAEAFLCSIDLELKQNKVDFIRYVDDYRIFGKSVVNVHKSVASLEILCRNKGLIPQSSKTLVKEHSIYDPPRFISNPSNQIPRALKKIDSEKALKDLKKIVTKTIVTDKSKFKYILYNCIPSVKIRNLVLKLLPSNQALIDVILFILDQYPKHKKTHDSISEILKDTPYQYVKCELMLYLSRIYKYLTPQRKSSLRDFALHTLKDKNKNYNIERYGCYAFLSTYGQQYSSNYNKWCLKDKSSLIQSISIPSLQLNSNTKLNEIDNYFNRTSFGPSLMITYQLLTFNNNVLNLGINAANLRSQTHNYLSEMKLISPNNVEPISELLERTYGVNKWKKWKKLLGVDYLHMLFLLRNSTSSYNSQRDRWLAYQNSFNHLLTKKFIEVLNSKNLPGKSTLVSNTRNGQTKQVKFGSLVQSRGKLDQHHSTYASAIRDANARRNNLPSSHPFEEKTGNNSIPLKLKERNYYSSNIAKALNYLISYLDSII